ncbi:2-dehydropantoate 2-reductase [uncultured Cloacibacillus sp.]|uniref:ketopantoate reductase family protein n=1 Tax=uncultured Cloacibacillus sp. TaxID=889794 RepID=UPI003208DAAA
MAKAITDVALIGLGAVGAAYLTSVADNFPECRIRVIAAGERAARLRAGGIVYNGRRYMFDVVEPQDGTPAGLLFVSVKNGQLSEAAGQAAAFVGPDTVIISPLNGVTSEKRLAERFGADNVVYSYAIKLDATRRGSETVCGNEGWIVFGDARNEPGRLSDNVLAVEEFFKRSRIEYEIPEDMIKSLWKKFMMNCGLNQTSAVLGFNYGLMQRSKEARSLMRSAMEEAAAAARAAAGVELGEAEIDEIFRTMDMLSPDGKTSMLQDVDARRVTEVDAFAETVAAIAREHGFAAPVNELYLRLIRAREESFRL